MQLVTKGWEAWCADNFGAGKRENWYCITCYTIIVFSAWCR